MIIFDDNSDLKNYFILSGQLLAEKIIQAENFRKSGIF
jgi:hypothetical protein